MLDKLVTSFRNAIRGIAVALSREQNFKIEIGFAVAVSILLIYLPLSLIERIFVIFAIALVLILELVNSANERFLNLYSKEHQPKIGEIKDLMAGAVLMAAFASLIIGLLIFLPYFYDWLNEFDFFINQIIKETSSAFLINFFEKLTFLGDWKFIFVSAFILAAVFFQKNREKISYFIIYSTLGAGILNQIFKFFFHRPRPEFGIISASGLSFPSGHATLAAAFYGGLIYIITKSKIETPMKIILSAVLFSLILIIGVSRIYLKVHYASDILGGYLVGGLWLLILAAWSK